MENGKIHFPSSEEIIEKPKEEESPALVPKTAVGPEQNYISMENQLINTSIVLLPVAIRCLVMKYLDT